MGGEGSGRAEREADDILADYYPFRVERLKEALQEKGALDAELADVLGIAVDLFERNDAAHGNLCAALIKLGRYERMRDKAPLNGYERKNWDLLGYNEPPVPYLEDIAEGYFTSTMDILVPRNDTETEAP